MRDWQATNESLGAVISASATFATRLVGAERARRVAWRVAIPCIFVMALLVAVAVRLPVVGAQGAVVLPNPILFVTQVPVPADFTTIGSVFGNHLATMDSAARGGDLWIRYGDGTLKNLTQAAGYGGSGLQGAASIAVREPSVHWSGAKALFSMVIGSPTRQYEVGRYYWQLYEITGLGPTDTPRITKIPNQPTTQNNISPIYGTDDRIIFTSDLSRNRAAHLSPQLDEYEEAPTVTGLWSLNPATGDLFMLQHSPSGSFSPQIDSFGRVVYVRWDHLQRDQQADSSSYGTFNYADESAGAARLNVRTEIFPEPLASSGNVQGLRFNHFFPWMINEDGTEEETLNHLGRHELHAYFDRSFNDDGNLDEFIAGGTGRVNPNPIENFLQMKESPTQPGVYFGVDAPEFQTHAAGQIVRLNAGVGVNPDTTVVTYVTHRDTHTVASAGSATHSGLYRNPLPLSNGSVVVAHTSETRADANVGSGSNPQSRYAFRLKTLTSSGNVFVAGQTLTPGLSKSVSWWSPDTLTNYSGPLWELDPVEVRARPRPVRSVPPLAAPVRQVFDQMGVTLDEFKAYLRQSDLALIVSNNVTTRDGADRQQPFNLRVAGTSTQSVGAGGKVYDISHLQLLQGDQIRGLGGTTNPRPGRRVLAQILHEPAVAFQRPAGAPAGAVAIAPDGSTAALVPARRAMTWQLTSPSGAPVVRERYWLTMQPGEIRVCASCHGVNDFDQAGRQPPTNQPEALRQLLTAWRNNGGAAQGPSAPRNLRIVE